MMKKLIKIKVEERTQLVEFLVTKRVKYFEYLKDIHSDEGGLWMNTVYFDRAYLGRYFGVASDCVASPQVASRDSDTAGLVRIPLDTANPFDTTPAINAATFTQTSTDGRAASAGSDAGEEAFTFVSLDRLPNPAATGRDSRVAEWQRRHLPYFVALGMALSDLLLVPMSGEEFIESVHHLLLELEVVFASGIAQKALAQRNLKSLRQHMSPAFSAALNGRVDDEDGDGLNGAGGVLNAPQEVPGAPTPAVSINSAAGAVANSTSSEQCKFVFLGAQHLSYSVATPSYDAVMPALFSALIFTYRRLCDYDLTQREDCVKRILIIDKRIEKTVLERVGKDLQRAARLKLVREAYVLSTRGLFGDVGGVDADSDFINDIVAAQVAELKKSGEPKAAKGSGSAGAAGDDSSSSSTDVDEITDT